MRSILACLAVVVLTGALPAAAQTDAKGPKKSPFVLGQVGLSFYAVVGGVVQEPLERAGYEAELVEGPHAEIFPRLGAGQVDLLAAAWLEAAGYELVAAPPADWLGAFREAVGNEDRVEGWSGKQS